MADVGQHDRPGAPTCRRRKRGQIQQSLGRSKGGFTTKIHALVDALGNPLRFILTGGERNDATQAQTLLDGFRADAVLADKGYDADSIIDKVNSIGAQAVIPPRSNRLCPREYDHHLYKQRNFIERFFNRIKHFRRVATRYDKLSKSYMSFILLASICIWLL